MNLTQPASSSSAFLRLRDAKARELDQSIPRGKRKRAKLAILGATVKFPRETEAQRFARLEPVLFAGLRAPSARLSPEEKREAVERGSTR
jgi:hypothetical protein